MTWCKSSLALRSVKARLNELTQAHEFTQRVFWFSVGKTSVPTLCWFHGSLLTHFFFEMRFILVTVGQFYDLGFRVIWRAIIPGWQWVNHKKLFAYCCTRFQLSRCWLTWVPDAMAPWSWRIAALRFHEKRLQGRGHKFRRRLTANAAFQRPDLNIRSRVCYFKLTQRVDNVVD